MDTQVTVGQRLAQIIESMGITPTEFARQIKVSQPAVALILGGHRGGVSVKMAGKITERYTEINPEWLLWGRGEMLRTHILGKKYDGPEEAVRVLGESGEVYETWAAGVERRLRELEAEVARLKG